MVVLASVAQGLSFAKVARLLGRSAFWLAVVVAALVLLGLVAYVLRRWVGRDADGPAGPGFSIEQIEQLHSQGRISDEEFRILRRRALPLDTPGGKNPASGVQTPRRDADETQAEPPEGQSGEEH